ncbi:LOW QUALITY PROTEIN: hypothetical protein TorRG33x02_227240 [Trema orientale]|uniref:Uncharacterized protein n=1 Tax=Trema orientale TaxID=63057 RepID=A0A2P5E7E3_TREOI|nr:LOW QUALITY PROTEIN: hypothetical protein TorRG33x02_227240 [Trema orientale]
MSSQNQLFEKEQWHFFDLGHEMVNNDEVSYTTSRIIQSSQE